jgi:hypothetical protein
MLWDIGDALEFESRGASAALAASFMEQGGDWSGERGQGLNMRIA